MTRYKEGDYILVLFDCHVCHDCVMARPLYQEWRNGYCYVKILVYTKCNMLLDIATEYVPLAHCTGAH